MSRASTPFRPATIAGLLMVGTAAFLLLLYALGQGWTGQGERDGGAHAASNSLNGFAGLADLLERRGHEISLSRSPAALSREALLVITPTQMADAEELERLIEERKYQGPTLLILPKWTAVPAPDDPRIEAEDGWVMLLDTWIPDWFGQIAAFENVELAQGETRSWAGLGMTGSLPDPETVQAVADQPDTTLFPLVTDREGDLLAGYWNQNGYFPDLADAAGNFFAPAVEEEQNDSIWPLVVVIEPDLVNNYGLADRERALLAVSLVEATLDGYDLPIVFDLTIAGLGSSQNLLTLAFRPPFLAATLCLLLAALVIAWRGFRRFGPPVAETPSLARGKTQLARNGAALIERAKRWHLLGAPYANMVGSRIARALHIRDGEQSAREAAIDEIIRHREIDAAPFSDSAAALREARRPADIIRAANALRSIERKLTR